MHFSGCLIAGGVGNPLQARGHPHATALFIGTFVELEADSAEWSVSLSVFLVED